MRQKKGKTREEKKKIIQWTNDIENQNEQIARENKQPETKEWRKEEIKNKKLRGEKGMRTGEPITHKKHRWRKGGGG